MNTPLDQALSQGVIEPQAKLSPVETMALRVSLGRIQRGDLPLPGMSAVCILALARLTGTTLEVPEGV